MKWYYIAVIAILLVFLVFSLNFSTEERITANATVTNSIVNVNANSVTVKNVYNFTVIVCYGNFRTILYPGQSVTFPYLGVDFTNTNTTNIILDMSAPYIILKAKGFEEIIMVNKYED